MYLKKLTIQGFKSFANRTTFEYTAGVTSVVGPNGSGKSNVADALRWVLGEQSVRLIRARKQEDVIFSGTSGRAAVGMAEVILTLDNTDRWLPVDFADVEVGRRVYRSGESEYLLNGSRVRLRDIIDLLMKGDVGQNSYTIMGQGLVDEVLSMSPDERRTFLDEAADVKRFRVKIKEAQDRLSATRENIDKVTIVVNEIEPRLAQLSRQAERAADHRRLSAELAELLRAFYLHRWNEAQNALVRARAALDQAGAESEGASHRVTGLREQLRALGEEIRRRREAISRRDSRQGEIEQRVSTTEQAIALDRERRNMVTSRREEVRLEVEALENEKLSLSTTDVDDGRRGLDIAGEMDAAKSFVQQCREGLELAEREYAAARSRAQELRDGAEADDRRISQLSHDLERGESRLAELARQADSFGPKRAHLLAELKVYGRGFAGVREQLVEAEDLLDGARLAAEDARARHTRVQQEIGDYEVAASQDLRQLDHMEGRLDALRRVQAEHDGIAAGTRNVLVMGQALIEGVEPGSLGEPPEIHGVIGLLSRQLRVPAGLEVAINAALENRLHAVVVESEETALKAIELLFKRRHGRAHFIALDAVRQGFPLNLQKERGVVGVAAKLVRSEPQVRGLVDTLLGKVIVVEDAATAQRVVRRGLGSVVTLDGVYIEAAGVLSGGATGADEGPFVRQREIEELPRRISELRARAELSGNQLEQGRQSVSRLQTELREAESRYDTVRKDLDSARGELERERGRLHRLRREMDAIGGRRADIARERERNERLVAQWREATAPLVTRRDERREALAGVERDLQEATARREAAIRAVSESSGRLASVEGERRALQSMREQHEKAIQRLEGQAAARRMQGRNLELEASVIDERLGKLAREMEAIRLEQARHMEEASPDRDVLHRQETQERVVQEDFGEAQGALLQSDRRRLDLEAEVSRLEGQLDAMRDEMSREGLTADRSGGVITLEEASARAGASFVEEPAVQGAGGIDVAETRRQIDEIRRQIRKLGPINTEAPEDYRESKERHEFLTSQMRDLADAEAQLREAIAQLTIEIRERFGVTFTKVNEAFGMYFTSFFGGGSAQLLLTDPDNVGEAGVEVEAQPPGKRVKTMSLLSGGERSLTAVALLFALLSVNPAPFCVLDEVDAALDEANVGRFSEALTKLAEKTQFIVITHNRRTVEVADSIYGVSMGRDGVSKVLSLRLADVPQNE